MDRPLVPQDLIGTMVPYDVRGNHLIGHHVDCKTIIPFVNAPGYLVNGNQLLTEEIVTQYLTYLADNRAKDAASGRPVNAQWLAIKSRWWSRAWRKAKGYVFGKLQRRLA